MFRLSGIKVVLLVACFLPASRLQTKAVEGPPAEAAAPEATKPAAKELGPGQYDASVAYVTARLLERNHYRQHPFDNQISEKFLDRYLEAFDPQHIHFTDADL